MTAHTQSWIDQIIEVWFIFGATALILLTIAAAGYALHRLARWLGIRINE